MRIWKVAPQRCMEVGDERVDPVVELLDRVRARRHDDERGIKLGEVASFDEHLELSRRAETELAPQQPPALDLPIRLQRPEVPGERRDELEVTHARRQVDAQLIDIHRQQCDRDGRACRGVFRRFGAGGGLRADADSARLPVVTPVPKTSLTVPSSCSYALRLARTTSMTLLGAHRLRSGTQRAQIA